MIQLLTAAQVTELYSTCMVRDFPEDELKPCSMILDLIDKNACIALGYYDNGQLKGYAFLLKCEPYLLLDYFAVIASCRNTGIGTVFLKDLQSYFTDYDAIFIEAEDLNTDTARARLSFYEKAGCHISDTRVTLYFVYYAILVLPIRFELSEVQIRHTIHDIYEYLYPHFIHTKYLIFE